MVDLESKRLVLKPITPAVIKDLFTHRSKESIISFLGTNEEGFKKYQEMMDMGMETNRISFHYFLVVNKTTNIPMGECGFHTWNNSHRRAELFYSLHKDEFKNQGFISEALPLVIGYGFTNMNLHRIEALIADDNIPSKRLLEKNNFTREGVVREDYVVNGINEDSICYSLLRQEWKSD